MHNDLILPVSQGGFYGARYEDGRVCIRDTFLRKYIPKNVKATRNINKIICGCETCISVMLL